MANSNLTKATFLEFYDKYSSSMTEQARLKSAHGTLLKQAKGAGVDLDELKLAYKQSSLDPAEIALHEEERRRYRLWLKRPVGFQANILDEEGPQEPDSPEDEAAVYAHTLRVAYDDGVKAGRAGADPAWSSFPAGTEEHQQYSLGYEVGKEMRGGETRPPPAANGGEQAPKRRGRPPGTKNKAKGTPAAQEDETPPPVEDFGDVGAEADALLH